MFKVGQKVRNLHVKYGLNWELPLGIYTVSGINGSKYIALKEETGKEKYFGPFKSQIPLFEIERFGLIKNCFIIGMPKNEPEEE